MNGSFAEESPVVGSKRSVRDRLGSNNVDSSGGFNNKRFCFLCYIFSFVVVHIK